MNVPFVFQVSDDSNHLVAGADITQEALVAIPDGTPIPGVEPTVNDVGNGNYSFAYDPEANGEALITFSASKVGSTITGANGTISIVLSRDSSRIQAGISSAGKVAAASLDSYVAPDNAGIAGIKAKTDLIPASPAGTADIPSASAIATAVWASGSRTLTSFGTLVSDIWANAARTLTSLSGLSVNVADKTGYSLASGDITSIIAGVWNYTIEGAFSGLGLVRLFASALFGKVTGAGTGTIRFRDLADTKDRITATVDSSGNRTAVTKDAS